VNSVNRRATSSLLTVIFTLACASGGAAELDRLPIDLLTTTVNLSFAANHETGSVQSVMSGFPRFDERLGSLDKVKLDYNLLYTLPDLKWSITAASEAGSARVDTLLTLRLDNWLLDTTSGAPFEPLTQEIWHAATCGYCSPGSGTFGQYAFPTTDSETLMASILLSTGFKFRNTAISVSSDTVNQVNGMKLSGDFTWNGQILVSPTYWAHTTRRYLDNAAARAFGSADDRAQLVAYEMVTLRNLDPATSQQNSALRTSEYSVMSFMSGREFVKNPGIGTFVAALYQGPIGVAGHNTIKGCTYYSAGCAAVWGAVVRAFGQEPTGPLPQSAPGGTVGSGAAWIHGFLHPDDVDGLGLAVESGTERLESAIEFALPESHGIFNIFNHTPPDAYKLHRLPPLGATRNLLNPYSASRNAEYSTERLTFVLLASEGALSQLALFDVAGVQNIESFSLLVGDVKFTLEGDTVYNLASLTGTPINGFAITDIVGLFADTGLAIDVAFSKADSVDLVQIAVLSAVPEVPVGAMFVAGLAVLLHAISARRTSQFRQGRNSA
jgi:hypothetical protein